MGPATTLTACHGCLIGPGSFVFVTIGRISFAVRHYDPESATVSSSSATHSGASLFGLLTGVLTVYAGISAGYDLRSASACRDVPVTLRALFATRTRLIQRLECVGIEGKASRRGQLVKLCG